MRHVAEVVDVIVVEGEGGEADRKELLAASEAPDLVLVEQKHLKKMTGFIEDFLKLVLGSNPRK